MTKSAANTGPRRRIVRWLVLCFAAAVVTSVLVAWGFASFGLLLIPEQSDFTEHVAGNGAPWMEYYNAGGRAFQLYQPTSKHYDDPAILHGDPPYFAAVPAAGDKSAGIELHGWPVVCLYCEYNVPETGRATVHGEAHAKFIDLRFTLPYKVHWLGMIADVGFYTTIFASVRFRPRAVIRWRRTRRGLCLSCGYDRRGIATDAACPECGTVPTK